MDSAKELGMALGKMAQSQSDLKAGAFGDEDEGLLNYVLNQKLVITGTATVNALLYDTSSFVLDHPVLGALDFGLTPTAFYNLDSTDTTAASGVIDQVGTADGTATGFDNYQAAVGSGYPMKGWYSFDSVATDASGIGNDLTATDITYVAGKLGNAASFNGTTSRLQDAAFSITGRQTNTIAVWVYVTDLSSQRTIISFGTGYSIYLQTNGIVAVEMNSAVTNSRRVYSTNSVPVNTWTHLVVIETGYSASNQARAQAEVGIWINGVQETTTTNTITASTADSAVLNVGCYNAASNFFQGYMDDLRIYAYIVSAQDIADIYNAGSGTTDQVLQPTWVAGTVGTWARNIRGGWSSGDHFSLGSVSSPAKLQMTEASSQTFSFWIYPRSIHGLTPIVSCGIFARGLQGLGFNITYTGAAICRISAIARLGGTGTLAQRDVNNVTLDAWHHVVLRYDASGLLLYLHVDNSSDAGGSTSAVTAFNLTSQYYIGSQVVSGNQTGTNAYIDDLRVYNRLLTTTEVATLYAKGEVAQGLILKYNFEEGTGNTLNDTYHLVEGPNTSFAEAWNLDGAGEYISAAATVGQNTGTFACWFRPNVSSATWGDFYLFDTATARHAFHSQANNSFEVYNDTRLHRYTVSVTADWHRFVVVYDKDTDRQDLYIDGVKQTTVVTTSGTWGTNVPGTAYIGSRFSASGTASGQIAGVSIEPRAWTDAEVVRDYNEGQGWDYTAIAAGDPGLKLDGGYSGSPTVLYSTNF